jgi:F-type H+-transporting ATPase subunit a
VTKRKILGCSFPVIIGIGIVFVLLIAYTLLGGPIGSAIFHIPFPSWLKVATPAPELTPEEVFTIGVVPFTNTMIAVWITIILLVVVSFFAFRKPKIVPRGLQLVMEFVFGSLLSFCESVAGEKNGRRFFPIVATIFVFVITNAWLSLVPIFGSITAWHVPLLRGANTDINVPLALALFSFVAVTYFGIKQLGFIKYSSEFIRVHQIKSGFGKLFKGNLKGALGEIMFGVIDLFSGVIELISQFIRIISFTFRLFGNMIAGEILLLVMTYLVGFGIPVIFYGLEVLVGFVQALIFGGLTLVFLTLAVTEHEEEHA